MDTEKLLHGKGIDFERIKFWLLMGGFFASIIIIGLFKQFYFLVSRLFS